MRVEIDDSPDINYLTIGGKPITSNANFGGATFVTGPLTATSTTDFRHHPWAKSLAINLNIGPPSGTSPTLTISMNVYEGMEGTNTNPVAVVSLVGTAITTATTVRIEITRDGTITVWLNNTATVLTGKLSVPAYWGLVFTIGGTTPSWPIVASYEAR